MITKNKYVRHAYVHNCIYNVKEKAESQKKNWHELKLMEDDFIR